MQYKVLEVLSLKKQFPDLIGNFFNYKILDKQIEAKSCILYPEEPSSDNLNDSTNLELKKRTIFYIIQII